MGHPCVFGEIYSYVNNPTKEYIITTKEYANDVLLCKLVVPSNFCAVENTVYWYLFKLQFEVDGHNDIVDLQSP